jgi:hypothetical protein
MQLINPSLKWPLRNFIFFAVIIRLIVLSIFQLLALAIDLNLKVIKKDLL